MDAETYRRERDLLIDAEREAARSYDKALIALSSGALALSFGYVRGMEVHPAGEFALYCSWAVLLASLFSVLLSFLLSQRGMQKQREILDKLLESPESTIPRHTGYAKWITRLNWASLFLLIIGVAVFAIFAAVNLFRSDEPCQKKDLMPTISERL